MNPSDRTRRAIAPTLLGACVAVTLCACEPSRSTPQSTGAAAPATAERSRTGFPIVRARQQLRTRIFLDADRTPAPTPPAGVFDKVQYTAPLGANVAYVTPPRPGTRRAAMIWIAGGFDWGIGEGSWDTGPRENDQTASVFRNADLVLMLPALRGANENPGRNECLLGEVDDVIAAAEYLRQRSDVDPSRIYLGGHSTGGTMALLVAESTPLFRAVFAFGPVADARQYGDGCVPEDTEGAEASLRAPLTYIDTITSPTFVIEGASGNVMTFGALEDGRRQAPISFVVVPGASHFSVLAPGSEVVARAIAADTGATPNIRITVAEIAARLSGRPD